MAESDAAGPGSPGGRNSRALTREDLDRLLAEAEREWESLTPEERARRQAESKKAEREAYEASMEAARPTLEAIERAAAKGAELTSTAGSGLAALFEQPPTPPAMISSWCVDRSGYESLLDEIEPVGRPLSAEEIQAAVAAGVREAVAESAAARRGLTEQAKPTAQGGASEDVVKKVGIVRVPRDVPLADRMEADWASEAGRRFLIGGKIRDIAAHYGVVHGSLYGVRLWKDKILPVRRKAQKGSKAAAWRDGFSREGH